MLEVQTVALFVGYNPSGLETLMGFFFVILRQQQLKPTRYYEVTIQLGVSDYLR